MGRLFEWIGGLIAILCLGEMISNPKQVLLDIQWGPIPSLSAFNSQLHSGGRKIQSKKKKSTKSRVGTHGRFTN